MQGPEVKLKVTGTSRNPKTGLGGGRAYDGGLLQKN